jgi:GTP-binding protein
MFIKDIGLELTDENKYGFENGLPFYIQDIVYNKFNKDLPFFVLPISSAIHKNIQSLKYVLYDLINIEK